MVCFPLGKSINVYTLLTVAMKSMPFFAYLSKFPFLEVGLEKEALKAVYQMKIIAPNKSLLHASSRLS